MSDPVIPDPRIPMLTEVISDLVAGYADVRRVLVEHYGAPTEVQAALLGTLRDAAERAAEALYAA